MQAIAQTGVAFDESTPSVARMLLWKEWRQQRWVFMIMAALPPLSLLLRCAVKVDFSDYAALLFLAAVPTILGAGVFCAEEEERTIEFLRTLPSGFSKVFWIKAGLAVALTLASAAIFAAARLGLAPAWQTQDVVAWAVCLPLAVFTAAMVSTMARGTVPCAIGVVVTGAALISLSALYLDTRFVRNFWEHLTAPEGVLWLAAFSLLFVTAGWRLWVWGQGVRTMTARVFRFSAVIFIIGFIAVAPLAGSYSYGTFVAGLDEFMAGGGNMAQLVYTSPDGRYALLTARHQLWHDYSRTALLDVERARWKWTTGPKPTWPESAFSSRAEIVLQKTDRLLSPFTQAYTSDVSFESLLLNAATGEARNLHSLCPALPARISLDNMPVQRGWFDADTLVLLDRKGMTFANVRTGSLHTCRPASVLDESEWWSWYGTRVPGKGIYCMPRERAWQAQSAPEGKLCLVRFAPELDTASYVTFQTDKPLALRGISADADWLVFAGHDGSCYVAENRAGASLRPVPDLSLKAQDVKNGFDAAGFLADNRTLLLFNEDRLMLLDAPAARARDWPDAFGPGEHGRVMSITLCPSRRYALVCFSLEYGPQYAVLDPLNQTRLCFLTIPSLNTCSWLGDDRLLAQDSSGLIAVSRDGKTQKRLELSRW